MTPRVRTGGVSCVKDSPQPAVNLWVSNSLILFDSSMRSLTDDRYDQSGDTSFVEFYHTSCYTLLCGFWVVSP